jgi:hypothetical protein
MLATTTGERRNGASSGALASGSIWVACTRALREDIMMAASDEVTGHTLRMAQERRLLRFCAEKGIDPNSPDLDNPDLNLLGPILDSEGAIVPDPEDIEAVK